MGGKVIHVNKESYITTDSAEFDFITVESDGFLYVGIFFDKILKNVTVSFMNLDGKSVYTIDDFRNDKEIITQSFDDLPKAEEYYNEIRDPLKIVHLVNKHKRRMEN